MSAGLVVFVAVFVFAYGYVPPCASPRNFSGVLVRQAVILGFILTYILCKNARRM